MGKLTISMAIFNSFLYVYRRVPWTDVPVGSTLAMWPCFTGLPHLVAFLFLKSSWIDPELTTRNNDRYHQHKWYIYIYMCILCSYIYNVTIPKGCQLNEKQYGTTCVYNSHQQQPFTEYRRCIELWWASQKSQSYLYSLYTITVLRTPSKTDWMRESSTPADESRLSMVEHIPK